MLRRILNSIKLGPVRFLCSLTFFTQSQSVWEIWPPVVLYLCLLISNFSNLFFSRSWFSFNSCPWLFLSSTISWSLLLTWSMGLSVPYSPSAVRVLLLLCILHYPTYSLSLHPQSIKLPFSFPTSSKLRNFLTIINDFVCLLHSNCGFFLILINSSFIQIRAKIATVYAWVLEIIP